MDTATLWNINNDYEYIEKSKDYYSENRLKTFNMHYRCCVIAYFYVCYKSHHTHVWTKRFKYFSKNHKSLYIHI